MPRTDPAPPATAEKDELIGRAVGSYSVVRLLGKGGMGAVYLAEHPVIGSRVAIKFLHPRFSGDRKIVERFFNEARAVNVIGHDNILKILDLDVTADGRHYFVMELLRGQPLSDLVKPAAPLPLSISGPILLQLCEALQAAHDHGIVHRDLKPDNVHLTLHKGKKNFVKVVDFGIAKLSDESGLSNGNTQTGTVMGTPAYMSPEQAKGASARIDGRSDVYSLGCMMFQMATGRLPFEGASFGEVLVAHLQQSPPRPRELAKDIPEAFEAVILRCLQKAQSDRYGSMREVHDAIAQVMDRLGISRDLPDAVTSETSAVPAAAPASAQVSATALLPPRGIPAQEPTAPLKRSSAAPRRAPARLRAALAALAIAAGAIGLFAWQRRARAEQASAQRVARVAAERVAQKAREETKAGETPTARAATDVVAGHPQVVSAQLDPEQKAPAKADRAVPEQPEPGKPAQRSEPPQSDRSKPQPPARTRLAHADQAKPAEAERSKPRSDGKSKRKETSDDTIPVDF